MWIDFEGTYGQLVAELAEQGESILGCQVHVRHPNYYKDGRPAEESIYLVGDVDEAGDISGEEYQMLTDRRVLRYRRLLTREQINDAL